MSRPVLDEGRVHSAVRDRLERAGRDVIDEVEAAVRAHRVVVVGMAMNPFPRQARRLLDAAGVPYKYLGYGSYLGGYRRRLPLKLWTGWTTFPMVFIDGVLIGGASDLAKLDMSSLKTPGGGPRA